MAKNNGKELTPMMKQFFDLKAKHPEALLLFRCGDFYETYCEDAITASQILGITLTRRNNGAGVKGDEMAGFPHHALDTYLPKLIRAGKRVAICDQLEDPKLTKKLVKRGITELVTPGVAMQDNVLNYKENNFLCAVHFGKSACGVSFLDISTGEFLTGEGTYDYVEKLMGSFQPKEVLYDRERKADFVKFFGSRYCTFELDDWVFTEQTAHQKLLKHFQVKSMKGFGVDHLKSGLIASGAILQYLDQTLHTQIGHITTLSRIRRWLVFPLKDVKPINARLDIVDYFFREPEFRQCVDDHLHRIGDLERIISKVAVGRVTPREVVQLKIALQAIEPIKTACQHAKNDAIRQVGERLIRDGVNPELDELRHIAYSGKDYLMQIQERETQATGIASLKIGYNNVFGYYLEVRNTYKDKVPADWVRKQTLAQAERYITQELKEYEEKILGAEDKILSLEQQLFNQLVVALQEFIPQVQQNANIIAHLDCLLSAAKTAEENHYIRPQIDESNVIDIHQGRHPVIETQLPMGEHYVPNDVLLDNERQQIIIITGPNMAGKSALLRQTALIVLLAQIGSFVPAESARIGLVDKIFTRVGASDNISLGESTFMVEMTEAANILNNVTPRSLVLFDELGRGTSTYDGISIAWAIVEYLHEHPKAQARTLFATHYHELNEMEKHFNRIRNYNVSVKEVDGKVIFLRKLEKGGSEHSFGIHVAEIAGMPKSIVKRANVILQQLEADNAQVGKAGKPTAEIAQSREGMQLSFFQLDDPVLCQVRDEILGLDVNNLTPLEALNKLSEIKKIVAP